MKGPPISETLDEDEEILGSDDDEQEDPRDYTKGNSKLIIDPFFSSSPLPPSCLSRIRCLLTCYIRLNGSCLLSFRLSVLDQYFCGSS